MYGMSNRLNETENCCTVEDKQRKKGRREGRRVGGKKETKEFEWVVFLHFLL